LASLACIKTGFGDVKGFWHIEGRSGRRCRKDGAHGIVNFIVWVTARTGLAYITQIEGVAACVAWAGNEFIGWV